MLFTWQWIVEPDNGAVSSAVYAPVTDVEVIDSLTAVAHFEQPNPLWFDIFSGTNHGYAYPKHLLEADAAALDKFRLAPIGTGPFVGDSFSVNNQVIYKANDTYREPTKPYFASILLKGGGDAPSAARAVLQTGDYDFVTNLSIEPEVLNGVISDDGPGVLLTSSGTAVERIDLSHSDPWTEVDGQRSHLSTPHPYFRTGLRARRWPPRSTRKPLRTPSSSVTIRNPQHATISRESRTSNRPTRRSSSTWMKRRGC